MDWFERTCEVEVRRAGEALDPFRAGLLFAREVAHPGMDPSASEARMEAYAAGIGLEVAAEESVSGKVAALRACENIGIVAVPPCG